MSYSKFIAYKNSPFKAVKGVVKWGGYVRKKTVDIGSGEVKEFMEGVVTEFDVRLFVKLYKEFILEMIDMPYVSLTILLFMMGGMTMNSDMVYFDMTEFKKIRKMKSYSSIYTGLEYLLNNGVIANSIRGKGYYFLNMNKIGFGRIKK